jgi:hypothetical protein
MITNTQSGTNIAEVSPGIYRINTPVPEIPGGFSFNQYLVVDGEPLLFHTGLRRLFPSPGGSVASLVDKLRYPRSRISSRTMRRAQSVRQLRQTPSRLAASRRWCPSATSPTARPRDE